MTPLLFGKRKPNFGNVNSHAGRNYYPDEIDRVEEIEIIEEVLKEVKR